MTEKQLAVLNFIKSRLATDGICPSYDEMMAHVGLKSKSGIHRIIKRLVDEGEIAYMENRARSIRIIDRSHPMADGHMTLLHRIADIVRDERHSKISKTKALEKIGFLSGAPSKGPM